MLVKDDLPRWFMSMLVRRRSKTGNRPKEMHFDVMAERGVPFREAHGVVGQIVRWCEDNGCDLSGLTRERTREFHPTLDVDLAPLLDPRQATERRTSRGGTAWTEIRRQVAQIREPIRSSEK